MISMLVGPVALARTCWEAWLARRGQAGVCIDLAGTAGADAGILGAILESRAVARDVAAFIARHTGESLAEIELRLSTQGRPERAALLDQVEGASRLPDVARLASALLEGAALDGANMRTVVTLLQLLEPDQRPALLLRTDRLERALAPLQELAESLPQLAVALAVERMELERFLARPASPHDVALVGEGLVELDEANPEATPPTASPAASLEPGPQLEALREELTALCQRTTASPRDPETAERARSLAERLLFAALEQHPATRGRFELNARMPFSFGPRAAEIDLISRGDELAIEIDGYYHFVDADAYRRDRRKDVLLQRHGLFVLRFLANDVAAELDPILDRIVDVLHRPRPSAS